MKIPVLYGQKGERRRSFGLANYPWQSMNVKRIIRDRVHRATLFSPVITLLLCPRQRKKEKEADAHSTFYSIVPLSSFPRTIHLVPRTFSKLKEISMQMRHGIKSKFASHDSTWKLFYVARKSFRFEETTQYRSNEIQTLSYRSDIWKCLFSFRSENTE